MAQRSEEMYTLWGEVGLPDDAKPTPSSAGGDVEIKPSSTAAEDCNATGWQAITLAYSDMSCPPM